MIQSHYLHGWDESGSWQKYLYDSITWMSRWPAGTKGCRICGSPNLYVPTLYVPTLYVPTLYVPTLYVPTLYVSTLYAPTLYAPTLC
jgi:hypothetical protein